MIVEREKLDQERTIETLRMKNEDLRRQIDRITIENDQKISLNEHLNEIDELKRLLDESNEKHQRENELLLRRVRDAENAKKNAQMKLSDHRNELQQIQNEFRQTKKLNRKFEIRIETLEKKLELEKVKEQKNLFTIEQLRQIDVTSAKIDEENLENFKEKLDEEKKRTAELERQIETTNKSNKKHVEQIQKFSQKTNRNS